MHPYGIELIVSNAFNGMGDASGSDEFGYSVAWIDLGDYLEDYPNGVTGDTEALSAVAIAANDGERYALAYIDADGSRYHVAYHTKTDVIAAYRALEAEFLAFEDVARHYPTH